MTITHNIPLTGWLREGALIYRLDGIPQTMAPEGVNQAYASFQWCNGSEKPLDREECAKLFHAAPVLAHELRKLYLNLEVLLGSNHPDLAPTREALEQAGFQFGDSIPNPT